MRSSLAAELPFPFYAYVSPPPALLRRSVFVTVTTMLMTLGQAKFGMNIGKSCFDHGDSLLVGPMMDRAEQRGVQIHLPFGTFLFLFLFLLLSCSSLLHSTAVSLTIVMICCSPVPSREDFITSHSHDSVARTTETVDVRSR